MKTTLLVLLLVLTGAVACTKTVSETQTVTATSPVPMPIYSTVTEAPSTPDPVVDVNPEAKACGFLKEAQTLPGFSSRWDDVMFKAEDAAKSDAMYKAIYKAENEVYGPGYNYVSEAKADNAATIKKFC